MVISSELIEVEIVGFKPNERVLLASLFKVSEMCTRAYREWPPHQKSRPDCLLIDIEHTDARLRLDLETVRKNGIPIVTVGPMTDKWPMVSAHINRPIRWAGILHTLDTVLGEMTEPPVSGPQVEEFSNRLNNLEVEAVGPWYDRSQPPKEFLTEAAVLVVDPDPDTSGFIREELMTSGYRVDTATNVTQASELVKKFRYNCIILEMNLPNEESIEFCMRIKQPSDTQRRTAVIILTANRNIVDRVRGSVAGCDAYLSKPVNPNTLMITLEKFLPKWKKK